MNFEIGQPCTPAIETKLENLGKRTLFIANGGGGIGGSKEAFVGIRTNMHGDFIEVELTESKRKMELGLKWIARSEQVTLYKRTHKHANPNEIKNPLITYFITKGDTELVLVNKFLSSIDELKNTKNIVSYVNWEKC